MKYVISKKLVLFYIILMVAIGHSGSRAEEVRVCIKSLRINALNKDIIS